jgi:DNA-binding XRE family transcriptional regulator
MRKVDDYIKEKMKKNPNFKARYDLLMEKAAVAKKIIAYRIRHKLSQGELAREIGVTQQYISKIEEGEFSNLDAIEGILEHIGYRLRLEVVPAQVKNKNIF